MDKRLTQEEKQQIMDSDSLSEFHFGLGTWIRNYWIYLGEKENLMSLLKDLGKSEFLIGDIASSAILNAYQEHLKEK